MGRRGGGGLGILLIPLVILAWTYQFIRDTVVQFGVGEDQADTVVWGIIIGTPIMIIMLRSSAFQRKLADAKSQAEAVILENGQNLAKMYRQKRYNGNYGEVRLEAFDKEISYFYETILVPRLNTTAAVLQDQRFASHCEKCIWNAIEANEAPIDLDTIPDDPFEFEHWTAEVLNNFGWNAQATQGSGDQGADVVADFEGHTCIIQCKLYKKAVGNKAVQEVDAARTFFDGDSAVVVGKSGYTRSARQLAQKNKVRLVDVADLPKLADLLELRNYSHPPDLSKKQKVLDEDQTNLEKSRIPMVRHNHPQTSGKHQPERAKLMKPIATSFNRESTVHLQNRDFVGRNNPELEEREDEH